MNKILIINTPGLSNRGSMAVVIGAINCLNEHMPSAHVTILCHYWETDREEYTYILREHLNKVRQHPWFRQHTTKFSTYLHSGVLVLLYFLYSILSRFLTMVGLHVKNIYHDNDLIIDLNTDTLTEAYGKLQPLFALFNMMLGIISGKPLVVLGTSVAPFKNIFVKCMAKVVLNQAKLITLRENASEISLNTLGVNKPSIYVTADFGFLLKPAPLIGLNQFVPEVNIQRCCRPLIGIVPTINSSIFNFEDITTILALITDTLIDKLEATVIYIPHSFADGPWLRAAPMSPLAAKRIYEKVENKTQVHLIRGEPLAHELKAVIGMCDIIISFMLHALIASMSSGVPSIAVVTYNPYKFRSILSMMDQDRCIVEVDKSNCENLKNLVMAKFDYVWTNKDFIHSELIEKTKLMEERARLNGSLLKTFVI